MTITIAVAGKSGSGKTAFTRAIYKALHRKYTDKSILMVDNSLGCDLAEMFGLEVEHTINSIRTGQYKYNAPGAEYMKKSEYVECSLHEIIINLDNDVDLLVSGPVFTEECTCITAKYIKDAMRKLIKTYDLVIFDCEYDLSYVNQLVVYYPDITLVLAQPTLASLRSAVKIKDASLKYAIPGQIGIILNKVRGEIPENIKAVIAEYDLDILEVFRYEEDLEAENITGDSDALTQLTQELLFRLDLPFWGE